MAGVVSGRGDRWQAVDDRSSEKLGSKAGYTCHLAPQSMQGGVWKSPRSCSTPPGGPHSAWMSLAAWAPQPQRDFTVSSSHRLK